MLPKLFVYLSFFLLIADCGDSDGVAKLYKSGSSDDEFALTSDLLLDTNLADGFAFPFGDGEGGGTYTTTDGKTFEGWYVATHFAETYSLGIHPGEDWNGKGGGNTDFGQPVYSIAGGKVLVAKDYGSPWGNIVMVEHMYLENNLVHKIVSLYAHLNTMTVSPGSRVAKRQQIGTIGDGGGAYPAHLHLEIRSLLMADLDEYPPDYWPTSNDKDANWVKINYIAPSEFIRSHRKLLVPAKAPKFVFINKTEYRLYTYEQGKLVRTYEVALSQEPFGPKEEEGDLKTPEGLYYIVEKTVGPFGNGTDIKRYLGMRWLRLNCPNPWDAQKALHEGRINKEQCQLINKAFAEKKETPKNLGLGGGVGIHGWIPEGWDDEVSDEIRGENRPRDKDGKPIVARNLTWGCISLRNPELPAFYDWATVGTPVILVDE